MKTKEEFADRKGATMSDEKTPECLHIFIGDACSQCGIMYHKFVGDRIAKLERERDEARDFVKKIATLVIVAGKSGMYLQIDALRDEARCILRRESALTSAAKQG